MVSLGGGRMLVVGGSADTQRDKDAAGAQALDPAAGKWTALAEPKLPLLPAYRAIHDPVGKKVYCLTQTFPSRGNYCLPAARLTVLDLGKNAWTRHEPAPALSDMDWHVMAIAPRQRKLVIAGAEKRPDGIGWMRTVVYDIPSGKYRRLPGPDAKVVREHEVLVAARAGLIDLIGRTRLAWFRDPAGVGTAEELRALDARCAKLFEMPGMEDFKEELGRYRKLLGGKKTLEALKAARSLQRRIETHAVAQYPVPPARQNSPLVYDAANEVFVLFGGDHQDYHTNDTWILDLEKGWRRAAPEAAPPPRAGHSLLYLPESGRVLMLGGYAQRSSMDYDNSAQNSYGPVLPHQAWTYDVAGDRWQVLATWEAVRDEKRNPWSCGRFYGYIARYSPLVVQADGQDRLWLVSRGAIWTMDVDPDKVDRAQTAKLAVRPNQRRYREGAFVAAYCEVPDTPEPTGLAELPENRFVHVPDPPRNVCLGARSRVWGTVTWDPDRDQILVWGGGHCVRSENPPIHYSPASGRMVEGYDAQEAYSYGGARGTTTLGRPWVSGHSWNMYAYDPGARKLLTASGYLYDPDRMDWVPGGPERHGTPPFAQGYNTILETTRHGVVAWARAGSWNSGRSGLWLYRAKDREWVELLEPDASHPTASVDNSTMVYDSKRDQLLLLTTPWQREGDGTLFAFGLKDRKLRKLTPANAELGRMRRPRESVYVEHADWVLFGTPCPDEAGAERKLTRGYDCRANRWMLLDFKTFPSGHTLSHGWVYDAARKLVYVVNTNRWAVWALRMDPETVTMLAGEPLDDAAEGARRLDGIASKLPKAGAHGRVEIIPPGEEIKRDRPRMLLRPKGSPHAIGLDQIKALKRDEDFQAGVKTLRASERAHAQALVWLLTGDEAAAKKALGRLSGYYVVPEDAFDVWFGLRELSLAYDWLYDHTQFTDRLKAKVRDRAFVLVEKWGLPKGYDHLFHNYTWMNNCGLAMWALASYGDDPRGKPLMKIVRHRMNGRLFPAMEHLNGMAGDAMGYWFIYCPASCISTLMAVQSAYDTDTMALIREKQNDWLTAQLEGSIHGTLPNMRFMPWGDMQAGPDGGVTHEWAGPADAATWALGNPHGAWFGRWLARKRGMRRFHREDAVFYFLYTRHIETEPKEPPLAMLAGGTHSAQAMMRSSWKDDATVIGFRCTDYYQGHFHHDAGSFIVYRNGLLAVDAGRYTLYTQKLRAPIIATRAHNSLLLGGRGQRVVKGQWYKSLAEFNKAREHKRDDRRLEFGDVPFYRHVGDWTAVAGQFAQAYRPGTVKSCVRQLLYVRPDTLVVVDHLVPGAGKELPEVTWLLNVPRQKLETGNGVVVAANETSWLRCRSLSSDARPTVEKSPPTQLTRDHRKQTEIARVQFVYPAQPGERTLLHFIEVGDGKPGAAARLTPKITADAVELAIDGKTFVFSKRAPYAVAAR
jgi:hypothetical protein